MPSAPAYRELLLEWGLNIGTPTQPTAFFIAFNTQDPLEAGTGEATELPRTAVTNWNVGTPADGTVQNTDAGETATGATGGVTVSHFSVWDSGTSSAGTYYFGGPLTGGDQILANGDKLSWGAGDLTASIT